MRNLMVGAALAAMLLVAGQAKAQFPTSSGSRSSSGFPTGVSQRTSSGFPFNVDMTKLISSVFGSSSSSSSAKNAPLPIARPQQVAPRNTSLSAFLPKVHMPSNNPAIGLSIYPTEDQMPGAAYLKAFGLKRAKVVPID
jgi:hypothetical protein